MNDFDFVNMCSYCGEPLDDDPVVYYSDSFHEECYAEILKCEGAAHLGED